MSGKPPVLPAPVELDPPHLLQNPRVPVHRISRRAGKFPHLGHGKRTFFRYRPDDFRHPDGNVRLAEIDFAFPSRADDAFDQRIGR